MLVDWGKWSEPLLEHHDLSCGGISPSTLPDLGVGAGAAPHSRSRGDDGRWSAGRLNKRRALVRLSPQWAKCFVLRLLQIFLAHSMFVLLLMLFPLLICCRYFLPGARNWFWCISSTSSSRLVLRFLIVKFFSWGSPMSAGQICKEERIIEHLLLPVYA